MWLLNLAAQLCSSRTAEADENMEKNFDYRGSSLFREGMVGYAASCKLYYLRVSDKHWSWEFEMTNDHHQQDVGIDNITNKSGNNMN